MASSCFSTISACSTASTRLPPLYQEQTFAVANKKERTYHTPGPSVVSFGTAGGCALRGGCGSSIPRCSTCRRVLLVFTRPSRPLSHEKWLADVRLLHPPARLPPSPARCPSSPPRCLLSLSD